MDLNTKTYVTEDFLILIFGTSFNIPKIMFLSASIRMYHKRFITQKI